MNAQHLFSLSQIVEDTKFSSASFNSNSQATRMDNIISRMDPRFDLTRLAWGCGYGYNRFWTTSRSTIISVQYACTTKNGKPPENVYWLQKYPRPVRTLVGDLNVRTLEKIAICAMKNGARMHPDLTK